MTRSTRSLLAFVLASTISLLHLSGTAQSSSASQDNLKAFEGYYQFRNDKNVYIQVTTKDNHLVLKQLWDEKEITFDRKSNLEFANDEGGNTFPLKFTKDQSNQITEVLAFDRDVWVKIKDYKPVVKKEIQLTEQQIKKYEGKYSLSQGGQDLYLQFVAKGNNLLVTELWSGREFTIAPESELDFFGKKSYYPVKFTIDAGGAVTQALIFDKDVWVKVKE